MGEVRPKSAWHGTKASNFVFDLNHGYLVDPVKNGKFLGVCAMHFVNEPSPTECVNVQYLVHAETLSLYVEVTTRKTQPRTFIIQCEFAARISVPGVPTLSTSRK